MNEPINIHEAKTQLSKLLSRVALGEEFTIANRGVPVAKLVPYASSENSGDKPSAWLTLRQPGRLAGQIIISDDFDEEDEEINRLFYGDDQVKLLLDTCCWLWWLSDTDKLSQKPQPIGKINCFYRQQVFGKLESRFTTRN